MFKFKTAPKKRIDWSHQDDAIIAITRAFKKEPLTRTLLVLPTGGGKTLTAIRSINNLLINGFFTKDQKVLWVVHTLSLKKQAIDIFKNKDELLKFHLQENLSEKIDVQMKGQAYETLRTNSNKYKLIIIDEAHHAAAATYREFFEYPVGILGLTATPRRMDNQELPFNDGVAYSITFAELVKRGVVLSPQFVNVPTNFSIDATTLSIENPAQQEKFNTPERNRKVAYNILQRAQQHSLKKVIVFVGTNDHVANLYSALESQNKSANGYFSHVGYIYGGDNNDRGETNEEYLKYHKSINSSILVNCKILNEGYDDPAIEGVVMGTPTNSIVYYMQCIGRVVRSSVDPDGKAYVFNMVDRLPNVSYRIDNRWLFSEISDVLEPKIIDVSGLYIVKLLKIYLLLIKFCTVKKLPSLSSVRSAASSKASVILFNDLPSGNFPWETLVVDGGYGQDIIKLFNDVSNNIESYYPLSHERVLETRHPRVLASTNLKDRYYRERFFGALWRAFNQKQTHQRVDSLIYITTN